MSNKRMKMVCKLEKQQSIANHVIKNVLNDDVERIATAMLNAYMGTIDQIEDTFEEAFAEVNKIFNHGYGKFIAEASFLVEQNNEVASVILVNLFEGKPLITEVFTGKVYYKQGMARALINKSMSVLCDIGYEELVLNVKEENAVAIKLYNDLGFKVVE